MLCLCSPVSALQEATAALFSRTTFSVVNIFDVALLMRAQGGAFGAVDVPEGNGSGVVWDAEGHVVTNYHGGWVGGGMMVVTSGICFSFMAVNQGLASMLASHVAV